jgi:septum formation protein
LDLRGRRHELVSAAALAVDGRIVWSAIDRAQLTMRAFSDAFLQSYLERAGGRVTESVGAYQLEGLGLQLFERIGGDYFTILGMPLLAVLAALRERGVVAS